MYFSVLWHFLQRSKPSLVFKSILGTSVIRGSEVPDGP